MCATAVVMSVVWVLLFPFGAAIIRLLSNRLPNPVAMHRGLQIANTLLAFVGLGLGVWVSNLNGQVRFSLSLDLWLPRLLDWLVYI